MVFQIYFIKQLQDFNRDGSVDVYQGFRTQTFLALLSANHVINYHSRDHSELNWPNFKPYIKAPWRVVLQIFNIF